VKRAHALFAAGLLGDRLREGYGVTWGPTEAAQFRRMERAVRRFWAPVPVFRRDLPYLYVGARRLVVPAAERVAGEIARWRLGRERARRREPSLAS
jgi:uncharacterized protein (DUF2236 family)